jgi:hypothetical protein
MSIDDLRRAIENLAKRIRALEVREFTGSGSAHNAVTLGADADTVLGLAGQAISLDAQTANRVLAGPSSGAAADPTFRALVPADIPTSIAKRTETSTYTETAGDHLIVCDKGTVMTVNLLPATGSGRVRIIKSINTGAVTVDGDSGDTIDGATTQVMAQWDSMQIVDYAAGKWVII